MWGHEFYFPIHSQNKQEAYKLPKYSLLTFPHQILCLKMLVLRDVPLRMSTLDISVSQKCTEQSVANVWRLETERLDVIVMVHLSVRANIVFGLKLLGLTWTANHWHSIFIVRLSIIIIKHIWRNIIFISLFIIYEIGFIDWLL